MYREFFLNGRRFIGGDAPSIADIRLAASLEFLRVIDYELPDWAEEYMSAIEASLGEAYSEPAARRARLYRACEVSGGVTRCGGRAGSRPSGH